MLTRSKKNNFELEQAKNLFWYICSRFNSLKLDITDIEPGKPKPHDEAVTIYFPSDYNQAFGSVQYYGGKSLYNKGFVRTIELRFYFKFLEGESQIRSSVNQVNQYRVEDRKPYLAFHFSHDDYGVREFIEQLSSKIEESLHEIYGLDYSMLHTKELSESIKLLPKLK